MKKYEKYEKYENYKILTKNRKLYFQCVVNF